uniref:G-protein coupled receptors family 1 profile domain-containing protein n=1 Tax=Phocoena sinus TaxID=42100 RepID=A0A8C9EDC4_PHOSS
MASCTADPDSLVHHADSCLPHHPPRVASVMLSLFYTAFLVFGTLGNILALRLAYQKGKKINSTNVYLVHLAVSDLLFTLALPGKIAYYVLDFSWPFGEGLCRLTAFIFYVNTYSGIYLMACVSVDRYVAVVRTHQCLRLCGPRPARLTCVAVWVLASLQTRAFTLCLQLTVCLMNLNCSIDPVIYFLASTRYRKWLLSIWNSSEAQNINQTGGSLPLEENEV